MFGVPAGNQQRPKYLGIAGASYLMFIITGDFIGLANQRVGWHHHSYDGDVPVNLPNMGTAFRAPNMMIFTDQFEDQLGAN